MFHRNAFVDMIEIVHLSQSVLSTDNIKLFGCLCMSHYLLNEYCFLLIRHTQRLKPRTAALLPTTNFLKRLTHPTKNDLFGGASGDISGCGVSFTHPHVVHLRAIISVAYSMNNWAQMVRGQQMAKTLNIDTVTHYMTDMLWILCLFYIIDDPRTIKYPRWACSVITLEKET